MYKKMTLETTEFENRLKNKYYVSDETRAKFVKARNQFIYYTIPDYI